MMKIFLITGGIILLGGSYFVIWTLRKAASDADRKMEYKYITKEDWEVMCICTSLFRLYADGSCRYCRICK